MTPLDQLRLRLPAHDFDRLMQAAKAVAEPDRDAMLKDIAAELGQHEVVGPGLLIGSLAKCSGAVMSLTSAALPDNSTEPSRPHRLMRMPLSPEQEILCERLEKGEPDPRPDYTVCCGGWDGPVCADSGRCPSPPDEALRSSGPRHSFR